MSFRFLRAGMPASVIAHKSPAARIIRAEALHAVTDGVVAAAFIGPLRVVAGVSVITAIGIVTAVVIGRSQRAADERTGGHAGANAPSPAAAMPVTATAMPSAPADR